MQGTDTSRACVIFYVTGHGDTPHSTIHRISIDLSKADGISLPTEGWDRFEELLYTLQSLPGIEIVVGHNESALQPVMDDIILCRMASDGKLYLWGCRILADSLLEDPATKEDVLRLSEGHKIDGECLKLSLMERLQFLTIKDKEKYLRKLLASRGGG